MDPIDLGMAFLGIAIMEAFVKPLAIYLTQYLFPKGIAEALQYADKIIPQLIAEGKGSKEVEEEIRKFMAEKTGDSRWESADMGLFWKKYDTRILIDTHKLSDR